MSYNTAVAGNSGFIVWGDLMGWYLDSGYFDVSRLDRYTVPFAFVVGGRGVGKTFGALKYMLEHKQKFVYLRRTQTEIDLISQPAYNPFKPITGEVTVKKLTKYTAGFYLEDDCIGYSLALSTVSHVRGFDASDVNYIIYDEFIPEAHARPIKEEGAALLNCYETINRNRELMGQPAVKLWCFANANRLNNPVFMSLGLINLATKLQDSKQVFYIDQQRGLLLLLLSNSPISQAKSETALYRLAHGTGFDTMAIDNRLVSEGISTIGARKLSEYTLLCTVGEISIYRHKSKREYYVTSHRSGTAPEYTTSEADLVRFHRKFHWLLDAYLSCSIVFETVMDEYVLTGYLL